MEEYMEFRVEELDEDGNKAESKTHPTGGGSNNLNGALVLAAELMNHSGRDHYRVYYRHDPNGEWTWFFDIRREYNPEI